MAGDPYWNNVVLAMHMDGDDGATTFTDAKGHAMTAAGTAQTSTLQSKFGTSSGKFGTSTANKVTARSVDFALGAGPFTIEFWVYLTAYNASGGMIMCAGGGVNAFNNKDGIQWRVYTSATGITFDHARTASAGTTPQSFAVPLNTWRHIAITYDGGTLYTFMGGSLATSLVTTLGVPTSIAPFFAINSVIGQADGATQTFSGYLDDVRVTKGVSRYFASFVPPTIAFPETMPAGDPYWGNVVLAMHMDGADGATTFTDVKGHAAGRFGTPICSTAQAAAGGSSTYFDGTVGNLNFLTSTDFTFGTGDFCLECWVYITALPSENKILINRRTTTNNFSYRMYIDTAGHLAVELSYTTSAVNLTVVSAQTIGVNGWHHLRVNRNSATVRLFLDGVLDANTGNIGVNTLFASTTGLRIGADEVGANAFIGYMDDVRITKGASREITSFIPYAPFPDALPQVAGTVKDSTGALAARFVRAYRRSDGALAGKTVSNSKTGAYSIAALDATPHFAVVHDGVTPGDPYWEYVTLAMHMDDAATTDLKGHTTSGGVRSATQSKFGGYSAYFSGTGAGQITVSGGTTSTDCTFGVDNFTVEAWVYIAAISTADTSAPRTCNATIAEFGFPGTTNSWRFTIDGSTTDTGTGMTFLAFVAGAPFQVISTTPISKLAWHHVAAVRSSGVVNLYVDGVPQTKTTNTLTTQDINGASGGSASRGASNWTGYLSRLNGYLDDVRITKCIARYTGDFSASLPTAPFLDVDVLVAPAENALILDNITPV